jgi:DNA-binding PadR family transcriptional regulator
MEEPPVFGPHPHPHRRGHFGFGFFGPHHRWADAEPPSDWPFGRFGRRWGGFGGFGGFNPGPGGERFFGRGDLKYVILDLLKDQPRHGYDIIRALEDRMRGHYRPSPGSVYPTLQMLEDLGYVTSSQQEGKKVYSITDEGRRYLVDQQSTVDDIRSRITAGWDAASRPEVADLMHEMQMLARALFRNGTRGALQDPERLKKLREILLTARNQIDALADERPTTPPTGAPPSEPRIV